MIYVEKSRRDSFCNHTHVIFFIFEVDIGKFLFNSLQKPSFILKNLTLLRRRTAGRGDVEAIKIVRFDDKVMSSLHFMYAKKEELLPLRCA